MRAATIRIEWILMVTIQHVAPTYYIYYALIQQQVV